MQVKTQLISTSVCTDRTLVFYAPQLAQMQGLGFTSRLIIPSDVTTWPITTMTINSELD